MKENAHIEALKAKQRTLKDNIHYAERHHFSDSTLKQLKVRNLALKDEIYHYYRRAA